MICLWQIRRQRQKFFAPSILERGGLFLHCFSDFWQLHQISFFRHEGIKNTF